MSNKNDSWKDLNREIHELLDEMYCSHTLEETNLLMTIFYRFHKEKLQAVEEEVALLKEAVEFCKPIIEDASTMNHDGQANWYIDNADQALEKLKEREGEE